MNKKFVYQVVNNKKANQILFKRKLRAD